MSGHSAPWLSSNPAALPDRPLFSFSGPYDLLLLLLSGLGVLFLLDHLLFCYPITDRVWKVTGCLWLCWLFDWPTDPTNKTQFV